MEFFRNGLYNSAWVKKYGLSTNALKLIALITMVLDHIGVFICRYESDMYFILRKIGRLSFPIFAFCLVIGFLHTKSRIAYAKRLFVFALVSEVPLDFATYMGRVRNHFSVSGRHMFWSFKHQNVFFTLLIGFVLIWCLDEIKNSIKLQSRRELMLMLECAAVAAGLGIAELLRVDYGYAGVVLIVLFYLFNRYYSLIIASEFFFNFVLYDGVQKYGVLSLIFLSVYNGKPGTRKFKWFFYVFYPAHLVGVAVFAYLYNKYGWNFMD